MNPTMNVAPMLDRLDAYDAWTLAVDLFGQRDYYAAATVLQHLVDTHPHDAELGAARELLVRSYFHSAQLDRAVEAARAVLDRDPSQAYVAMLLARALERSSRRDEAEAARRFADVLGGAA